MCAAEPERGARADRARGGPVRAGDPAAAERAGERAPPPAPGERHAAGGRDDQRARARRRRPRAARRPLRRHARLRQGVHSTPLLLCSSPPLLLSSCAPLLLCSLLLRRDAHHALSACNHTSTFSAACFRFCVLLSFLFHACFLRTIASCMFLLVLLFIIYVRCVDD